MKFSETSARKLDLPPGKAEAIYFDDYFDDDIPGFGLRLRAGGSRAWVVQYKIGSKQRRMTLGSIKTVSATKARDTAKDILASVRLGKDPAGEKAEARINATETFKLAVDRFLISLRRCSIMCRAPRQALQACIIVQSMRPRRRRRLSCGARM